MLARTGWIKDISVRATRGRTRAIKDGLAGTTLYVPPAPTYKRLVPKKKRETLVAEVGQLLKRGRLSPFEHEAALRTGLRVRFIAEGHSWAHSDLEAEALIEAAFKAMGVERPTWEAGQPNATTSPDYCQCCHSPLDDADKANHRRFCCDTCSKVMKGYDWERWYRIDHGIKAQAAYLARLDELPERSCIVCGAGFRSVTPETKTCSPECAGVAKRSVPEKSCQHCGKRFRPHSRAKVANFCSKSCADQSRRLRPKTCLTCQSVFQPVSRHEVYCSAACKPGLPEIPCGHCGALFGPATKRATFCSRKCKDDAKNRRRALDFEAARAFLCEPC